MDLKKRGFSCKIEGAKGADAEERGLEYAPANMELF
jgi:hypothetical protein